jgi:hypothetical protein
MMLTAREEVPSCPALLDEACSDQRRDASGSASVGRAGEQMVDMQQNTGLPLIDFGMSQMTCVINMILPRVKRLSSM